MHPMNIVWQIERITVLNDTTCYKQRRQTIYGELNFIVSSLWLQDYNRNRWCSIFACSHFFFRCFLLDSFRECVFVSSHCKWYATKINRWTILAGQKKGRREWVRATRSAATENLSHSRSNLAIFMISVVWPIAVIYRMGNEYEYTKSWDAMRYSFIFASCTFSSTNFCTQFSISSR